MPSFDIRDNWASILLIFMLFLIILLILYPYLRFALSLKQSGMSYKEIYQYLKFILFRSSNSTPLEYPLGQGSQDKLVVPKQVEPYVFYCSECKITSVGYEVLCPKCGKLMIQPRFKSLKSEKNNNQSCVLCHNTKCPECNLEINGNKSCKQACPYCESMYHYHCWIMTMKEFGKCGHCLEKPPPEFEKLISKKQKEISENIKEKKSISKKQRENAVKTDETKPISKKQQEKPPEMDEAKLIAKFEAETGKNAIWGNKLTKNYLKWKERNMA